MLPGQRTGRTERAETLRAPTDTSRFIQYRLRARYDIEHKEEIKICHALRQNPRGSRPNAGGEAPWSPRVVPDGHPQTARGRSGPPAAAYCRLLPGCPDNFADPGAGLSVERPGHVTRPGLAVRFDLLQDHPSETREDGGGNNGQQHGFRFLRHKHMLLTGHRGGHSVLAGHTA